ncbi:AAA family ATPase [Nocardiopsis deserti]|uniref:AAA family ATPase n=1 Tax=Nocardiopsis deserti TaxID=2605988 RepID=UPI001CC26C58|nr:AAA family ATPase [Nocardiopsis deserti]
MAVLTAIAVIVAALVFAETLLVYVALGLAGVSVLLLLGALLQGRSGSGGRPDRTDGLGKASVPVMAATAAAAVPTAHVESENPGRVPAPASEPVREPHATERPVWPTPAAEDAGHGEPEYDVPRWQTPTAHDWPEPDTAAHDAAPSAPFAEPSPSWAAPSEEEQPLRAPASWESGADAADSAARAEWDEWRDTAAAEDGPDTGDETGERTATASGAAFTYDIPGRTPAGDGFSAEDRPPFGEDAVEEDADDASLADAPEERASEDRGEERGGSVFASEEPFVYSIPRPAEAVEERFPEDGGYGSGNGVSDAAFLAYDVPGDQDQDGDRDGVDGQRTGASDRASFAYDLPGRSSTEETVEEDAFEDGPSRGDDSRAARDAVEEDVDDAPFADASEEREAGEPSEDTAIAGADGAHDSDEAAVPTADHEDDPDTPQAHAPERTPGGPGTDGDDPETAVLPVVSEDFGPEEGHAPDPETAVLPVVSEDFGPEEGHTPDGDRGDGGTGGPTDEAADSTPNGDRTEDDDADGGRGARSAFSYRIPRGDDEDGARAGEAPADAEPDPEGPGEDGPSAARTGHSADGPGDGPDDGAQEGADRTFGTASDDDASDTKR